MQYVRLYSDQAGESHFEDVEVELNLVSFAPPAPPLNVSGAMSASQFLFVVASTGWVGDWHPAPTRQFFCILAGEIEVTASDGESRQFSTGAVLLVEDTTGRGHTSKTIGKEDALTAVTQVPE